MEKYVIIGGSQHFIRNFMFASTICPIRGKGLKLIFFSKRWGLRER